MVKMSFSGSDSEQYSNVEPPRIDSIEGTCVSINGFWCSKGVQVTLELRIYVRVRR
jgi:hypothetical protein